MTRRQLEAFVAIVNHGTFSGAAVVLNVTQGAISSNIKHLEKWLQCQLIAGTSRDGVVLTPHGAVFLPYARRALQESHFTRITQIAVDGRQVVHALEPDRLTRPIEAAQSYRWGLYPRGSGMTKCSDCGIEVPATPEHSARVSAVKCPDCVLKSTEPLIRNPNETIKDVPCPDEPPEAGNAEN